MSGLIDLLITLIVIGVVAAIIVWLIDMLPIDGRFKQVARVLVMLVAVLIVLMRALPLLGVYVY
jgi:hypothetical protein